MVWPSSLCPDRMISDPLRVTCNLAPLKQFELRFESATRCPRESRLISNVIVNAEASDWLEKNEPDHVPCMTEASWCPGLESNVSWFLTVSCLQALRDGTPPTVSTNKRSVPHNKGFVAMV